MIKNAIIAISLFVLLVGCAKHTPAPPISSPQASELQAQVGQHVTLVGQFSLRGKEGPYILYHDEPVYIIHTGESFSWGRPYSDMEGRLVNVTGTLRFHHRQLAQQGDAVQISPDYFYFELEQTTIQLVRQE